MLKLIKKHFDLCVKMQWLKEINKAVDERNKAYKKYVRKCLALDELIKEFNKKYPNDILKGE